MPVPDKHADELTQEIGTHLYLRWQEARSAEKAWKEESERLRKEIEAQLGTATAGTISGEKVVSYRPGEGYAWRRIMDDYPDLAEHFVVRRTVNELDVDRFAAAHPDIAEVYRIRSFREIS